MQLTTSLAILATAVSSVNALGSAIINNHCSFPVYLWAVDAQRNPSSPSTIAPGATWSEPYHTPSSGGVSLKLSLTQSNQYCTQFEYTVQSYLNNPFVWYDGSNVNCVDSECPFWNYGVSLETSNPSCPTRNCPVGQACSGFYTVWNDDVNSLSCDDSSNVIMNLCTVNTGSSGASSSPQQKAAVVSAAPAPTTTKAAIVNEAVVTTFVTAYAAPSKRAEAHHGHMHFHNREAQE